MYENESAAVRRGIDFLTALNEKDYLLDLSFDSVDLERKLDEIQADVNVLISNLPVEAIDDDEEREMEYPGDFEDSEELEDEVVECEKLISLATKLLETVRDHYLPSNPSFISASSFTASQQTKLKRIQNIDWTFIWIIIILGILFLSQVF